MRELLLGWSVVACACASPPPDDGVDVEQLEQATVWGAEDRIDWFQSPASWQAAAENVGLFLGSPPAPGVPVNYAAMPTLSQAVNSGWGMPLCAGQPFANQTAMIGGGCTVWLASPTVAVTARHCLQGMTPGAFCSSAKLGFRFDQTSATTLRSFTGSDVYSCRRWKQDRSGITMVNGAPRYYDHLVIELDRPVVGLDGGYAPGLEWSAEVGLPPTVLQIGHPRGVPKKLNTGGLGNVPGWNDPNGVQEAPGRFNHFCDTSGGNSGSPLLNPGTLQAVGIAEDAYPAVDFVSNASGTCMVQGAQGEHANAGHIGEAAGRSFTPQIVPLQATGTTVRFAFAADVSGDGFDELITLVSNGTTRVFHYLASLDQFGDPWISDGLCYPSERCAVGDVNGDGRVDLVAFSNGAQRAAGVWVGLSNGLTFAASQLFAAGDRCAPDRECHAGDFDGDDRADLVSWQKSGANKGRVRVSFSTGNGFTAELVAGTYCPDCKQSLFGDIRGTRANHLVLLMRDSGDALEGNVYALGWASGLKLWHSQLCVTSSQCMLADINGDGRDDLIDPYRPLGSPATLHGIVALARNWRFDGERDFANTGCAAGKQCLAGDFNGDGVGDLGGLTLWNEHFTLSRGAFLYP